ncbi:hypothetical protein Bbelb_353520 [Branchiostoma belcheri]|nr:hypothetical protein Bbelb_353520 [Branchiostoma belcheri]
MPGEENDIFVTKGRVVPGEPAGLKSRRTAGDTATKPPALERSDLKVDRQADGTCGGVSPQTEPIHHGTAHLLTGRSDHIHTSAPARGTGCNHYARKGRPDPESKL